jgi:drug/metabolite transporter (DMT)-like permease
MRPIQNRGKALAFILGAVAIANLQDAIVKGISETIPAYETLIYRTVFAAPFLVTWLFYSNSHRKMFKRYGRELFIRSLILCSAYLSFILAIAALPLATAISLYFTMPFFVAGFSGLALQEAVPRHRWIAIAFGFVGVLVTVRPGFEQLKTGHFFALYAAFGYAIAQIWGRSLAHRIEPAIIVNWQNMIYFGSGVAIALVLYTFGRPETDDAALTFLTRPWATPSPTQFWLLAFMGVVSALVAALFLNAYRFADASLVAPFEYSAIVWATLYDALLFQRYPSKTDLLGSLLVIAAGLYMLWRDKQAA